MHAYFQLIVNGVHGLPAQQLLMLDFRREQLPLELKMVAPHVVDQITRNAELPMEVGGIILSTYEQ